MGLSAGSAAPSDVDASDRSTRLAITRTDLALERSLMAAERTLMAWIRTSLAMISFGFTLGKLADAPSSARVNLFPGRTTEIIGVAYYLVILGTLALVLATIQNRVEVAGLFRQGLARRPSLAFVIAILLSLLGLFAFTDLVTQFRETTGS
jgi:putative membrane protein